MTPDKIGRENSFTTSPLDGRDQFGRSWQFSAAWRFWHTQSSPCGDLNLMTAAPNSLTLWPMPVDLDGS